MKEKSRKFTCKSWLMLCAVIVLAAVLACPVWAAQKSSDTSSPQKSIAASGKMNKSAAAEAALKEQQSRQRDTEREQQLKQIKKIVLEKIAKKAAKEASEAEAAKEALNQKDSSDAAAMKAAEDESAGETNKWKALKKKYAAKKKVKQLIFVKYKGNSEARLILYDKVEVEPEEAEDPAGTETPDKGSKAAAAAAPTDSKKAAAAAPADSKKAAAEKSAAAKSATDPTDGDGEAAPAEPQVKWKKVMACKAYVGQNGINKEKEGDRKTPVGDFTLTCAFGVNKNPGSKMDYIKLNDYLYWCGDRDHYNQMIDIRKYPHSCRGEHLINYTKQYAYAMALNYNKKCVYGKGSAIFLHCYGYNNYTLGCIAVSEDNMKTILKTCEDKSKICIYEK